MVPPPARSPSNSRRGNWEPEDLPSWYPFGWLSIHVAVEAIRLAMEEVGYENLNGSVVRDALFQIKDFDTGLVPPITITEEEPYMIAYNRIYEVRDGKLWGYSDWLPMAYPFKP